MERLLEEVWSLREKCSKFQDEIISIIKADQEDIRVGCFGMIFNQVTQTYELLRLYYEIWRNPSLFGYKIPSNSQEIEQVRKENTERCIMATKWLFIGALSSIEYSMKETIKLYPKSKIYSWFSNRVKQGKRVYLSGIIEKSVEYGLIDESKKHIWMCLIKVRNTVIHNNAIADENANYQIGDLIVSFREGQMLRGKLDFFVRLTDVVVNEYYHWLRQLININNRNIITKN